MFRPLAVASTFIVGLAALLAVALGANPGRLLAANPPSVQIYLPLVISSFFDDFSNPSSGWTTGAVPDGAGGTAATENYLNGAFQILFQESNWLISSGLDANGHTGLLGGDFQASMQVWNASSAVGTSGFYFGSVPCTGTGSPAGFYDFEVGSLLSQSGSSVPSQYYLARYNYSPTDTGCTGAGATFVDLAGPAASPSILPGQATNTIAITRSGSTFTIYANNALLAQVTDSAPLPEPGYLGLAASSYSTEFDARFDNFSLTFNGGTSSFASASSLRSLSPRRETSPILIRPSHPSHR